MSEDSSYNGRFKMSSNGHFEISEDANVRPFTWFSMVRVSRPHCAGNVNGSLVLILKSLLLLLFFHLFSCTL